MSLSPRLQHLLGESRVPYAVLPHPRADTALGVAHTAHIAGRRVAKVVVIRDSFGSDFMVVLPAQEHVDAEALRHLTGRGGLQLEDEGAMEELFPDCEVGAMPPFGRLYGMPTYLDRCMTREEDIYFQGGNHRELVRMRFADYERLASPIVGESCLHVTPVGSYG